MGAKQTKSEGYSIEEYLVQHSTNPVETKVEMKTSADEIDLNDPRSPAMCRTPISVSIS